MNYMALIISIILISIILLVLVIMSIRMNSDICIAGNEASSIEFAGADTHKGMNPKLKLKQNFNLQALVGRFFNFQRRN